ncbi:glycogen debranching protein GlgX [Paraoerskovia marina]|uniref:glycogen debranching protein GlgX n=1 Tax=Paraoerskovia marina TaxID=545619 RepID=UPI000AC20D78|nr:glycogen debranching protein GlgX [Paraoerskovia marina]
MTQPPAHRPTVQPTDRHGHVPPLGVHLAGDGVDVAVAAPYADAVELCLHEPGPRGAEQRRIRLDGPTYGIWHGHVPDVEAGQHYGFRTYGRWAPREGHRHNPAKLLVDPYARAIVGGFDHDSAAYGQEMTGDAHDQGVQGDPYGPADERDSAPHVPRSVVVAPQHPEIVRPHVPWSSTVVYEAHVRGLTQNHPGVPEHLRGTYAGLAHPVMIDYLRSLGVTTVELLPVHAFVDEPHLLAKDLTNYWGYATLGYFAPHAPYATRAAQEAGAGAVVDEIRGMVHLLHEAGIEVILDVVYNHTGEAGDGGPHLSFRGLDDSLYYRRGPDGVYDDVTGTGNTVDTRRSRVVQLVLDSLRYWASEIGVDGFRFDLAVSTARQTDGFDPRHPLLVAMQTDPVISGLKLIAEPWDVGLGGWNTGGFPPPFAEWNDRYRDAVRQFWLADAAALSHGRQGDGVRELATRLAGSQDLFGGGEPPLVRGPVASINLVTAHDGFTLADLVAYDHKHNEANGEDGRDGSDDNRSWNHGIEGRRKELEDGDDLGGEIAPLRRRSVRNLLATLILSAGTPMITAGDERGRTQRGNNNAYCQDNEISWMDWSTSDPVDDLRATVQHLLTLRSSHRALRADAFFLGRPRHRLRTSVDDLSWHRADGAAMQPDDWDDPGTRVVQMLRTGPQDEAHDVLVVLNGSLDAARVTLTDVELPDDLDGPRPAAWELAWDSAWERPDDAPVGPDANTAAPGDESVLEPLSLQVWISV